MNDNQSILHVVTITQCKITIKSTMILKITRAQSEIVTVLRKI